MPRNVFTPRLLGHQPPDRCELCPLVGLIPKEDRREGKRQRFYCLGIYEPEIDANGEPVLNEKGEQQMSFPRLSSRLVCQGSAKKMKAKGHLLHRPCDYTWESWMTLPGRIFGMPVEVYNAYRAPFEKWQMTKNMPKFKFRNRK